MKMFLYLVLYMPFVAIAQEGVRFEQELSWQQVQAKAKEEKKLIFVDCFASWCGPCKKMDQETYPQETVGNIMNANFISVKVQMDTTKHDGDDIKNWYLDAHEIGKLYDVDAYPSLLFFNSDGQIIYRALGYKATDDFISIATSVSNQGREYYPLLKDYENGKVDSDKMIFLATTTQVLGNDILAEQIANKYIGYVKNKKALFTKDNIQFMSAFTHSSSDNGFDLFYHHAEVVDGTMGSDDYAQGIVAVIITSENINPILEPMKKSKNLNPDWNEMFVKIKKKYNRYYADRTIIGAKVGWYGFRQNWEECTKYLVLNVERSSPDSKLIGYYMNNNAWFVFQRSSNKKQLKTAIGWMENLFQHDEKSAKWGTALDTYANLLYKSGRRSEALLWEEKAVRASPNDSELLNNYRKMNDGKPTWPVPKVVH